jgi:outer membrane lipoprotein-sorting protein
MRQWIGLGLICLVAGGWIGMERACKSDPEAVRLIRQAMQAPLTQDYTAQATTLAYYGSRPLQTEATVYNARGGMSRIEYRLGSLAGVIAGKDGKDMNWRYDPLNRSFVTEMDKRQDDNPTTVGDPNTDPDLNRLLSNCQAKVVKHTNVAGRPATEIMIRPKGVGNSRSLWVDNDTGVILRCEERNTENELVSATAFRSITYGQTATPDRFMPIPPSGAPVQWKPETDFAARTARPEEVKKTVGVALKQPSYVPAGYSQEGVYIYHCPVCSAKVAITRYVNGLNSVTVVQTSKACEHHAGKNTLDFGLGKAVFAKKGDSYFSVLGELPEAELKRVADSISM